MKNFFFAEQRLLGFAGTNPELPQKTPSVEKIDKPADLKEKSDQLDGKIAQIRSLVATLDKDRVKEWEKYFNDTIDTINAQLKVKMIDTAIDTIDKCLEQAGVVLDFQVNNTINITRINDKVTVEASKDAVKVCITGGGISQIIQPARFNEKGVSNGNKWTLCPTSPDAIATITYKDGTKLKLDIRQSGTRLKPKSKDVDFNVTKKVDIDAAKAAVEAPVAPAVPRAPDVVPPTVKPESVIKEGPKMTPPESPMPKNEVPAKGEPSTPESTEDPREKFTKEVFDELSKIHARFGNAFTSGDENHADLDWHAVLSPLNDKIRNAGNAGKLSEVNQDATKVFAKFKKEVGTTFGIDEKSGSQYYIDLFDRGADRSCEFAVKRTRDTITEPKAKPAAEKMPEPSKTEPAKAEAAKTEPAKKDAQKKAEPKAERPDATEKPTKPKETYSAETNALDDELAKLERKGTETAKAEQRAKLKKSITEELSLLEPKGKKVAPADKGRVDMLHTMLARIERGDAKRKEALAYKEKVSGALVETRNVLEKQFAPLAQKLKAAEKVLEDSFWKTESETNAVLNTRNQLTTLGVLKADLAELFGPDGKSAKAEFSPDDAKKLDEIRASLALEPVIIGALGLKRTRAEGVYQKAGETGNYRRQKDGSIYDGGGYNKNGEKRAPRTFRDGKWNDKETTPLEEQKPNEKVLEAVKMLGLENSGKYYNGYFSKEGMTGSLRAQEDGSIYYPGGENTKTGKKIPAQTYRDGTWESGKGNDEAIADRRNADKRAAEMVEEKKLELRKSLNPDFSFDLNGDNTRKRYEATDALGLKKTETPHVMERDGDTGYYVLQKDGSVFYSGGKGPDGESGPRTFRNGGWDSKETKPIAQQEQEKQKKIDDDIAERKLLAQKFQRLPKEFGEKLQAKVTELGLERFDDAFGVYKREGYPGYYVLKGGMLTYAGGKNAEGKVFKPEAIVIQAPSAPYVAPKSGRALKAEADAAKKAKQEAAAAVREKENLALKAKQRGTEAGEFRANFTDTMISKLNVLPKDAAKFRNSISAEKNSDGTTFTVKFDAKQFEEALLDAKMAIKYPDRVVVTGQGKENSDRVLAIRSIITNVLRSGDVLSGVQINEKVTKDQLNKMINEISTLK